MYKSAECASRTTGIGIEDYLLEHAPYQKGDVVAVAQSYKDAGLAPGMVIRHKRYQHIRPGYLAPRNITYIEKKACEDAGWYNKMFVNADLMPNRIYIKDVKVERLQAISDIDCLREGIQGYTCNLYEFQGDCYSFDGDKNKMGTFLTPRDAFVELIRRMYGKEVWEENPLVYVDDFYLL